VGVSKIPPVEGFHSSFPPIRSNISWGMSNRDVQRAVRSEDDFVPGGVRGRESCAGECFRGHSRFGGGSDRAIEEGLSLTPKAALRNVSVRGVAWWKIN